MKTLVLTGGGSAGHAVPNTALIPELSQHCNLAYIGTDGIEKKIIAPYKLPYRTIRCTKFIRGMSVKNFAIPFRFLSSIKQAKKALKELRADAVFSKGGYVALPVVFAAKSLKIPVLSHESDLSPGLANRLISKKSRYVLTSFPETAKKLKNGKYVGSPVRDELFGKDPVSAKREYGFKSGKPVLLVFGGGSGSRAINAVLREALFPIMKAFDILHICGKGNLCESKIEGYVQKEYETDMASAYAAADFVLSRAGSNTVFEILALGKPALFIPLENKRSRGDQIENADYFEKKGLCKVLREPDLSPEILQEKLLELREDYELKKALQNSSLRRGNEKIIREILSILK